MYDLGSFGQSFGVCIRCTVYMDSYRISGHIGLYRMCCLCKACIGLRVVQDVFRVYTGLI